MASPSASGDLSAARIAAQFGMQSIPHEGALFAPLYRSDVTIGAIAERGHRGRPAFSVIHTLITREEFSAMHRLDADEVWHFCGGAPLELLLLHPDGRSEVVVMGGDVAQGQCPVVVVPRGVWQGARIVPGADAWTLLSHTVVPGFEYAGYEAGARAALVASHPAQAALIHALTREDSRERTCAAEVAP